MDERPLQPKSVVDAASHESLEQRKARVEEGLVRCMQHGRLGMHVWEERLSNKTRLAFPDETLMKFYPEKTSLTQFLKSDARAVISGSLLPPPESDFKLVPFRANKDGAVFPGYLIDFSEVDDEASRHTSPIVLQLNEDDLHSGWEVNKDVKLRRNSNLIELKRLYDRYVVTAQMHGDSAWYEALAKEPAALSAQQLDILSQAYRANDPSSKPSDFEHNEVLAMLSKQHICGIFVPCFEREALGEPKAIAAFGEVLENFTGALAGIQHSIQGIDVPVVRYFAKGEKAGQCEYLAQGKQECLQLMQESLRYIKQNDHQLSVYFPGCADEARREIKKQSRLAEKQVQEAKGRA